MHGFETQPEGPSCGLPQTGGQQVLLAHGGGGRVARQLIRGLFARAFGNAFLDADHDSAALPPVRGRLAFTTDSFVVKPLFFPGGDIGKLAVYGTVNDLAMSGALPLYLSLGVILEEGFPLESLERIVGSIAAAARECGVAVVAGDTKVVERGKGDGVFLNTSGVGEIPEGARIEPRSLCPGDAILLSGDLGRHGIAVMAAREGIEFETTIRSDCAPLHGMVRGLLEAGVELHCLRDLTRGGLASALNEIAQAGGLGLSVEEAAVPVAAEVRGACEMLGLDPFYVANEGRFVAFVPEPQAERALALLRAQAGGEGAVRIGSVAGGRPGRVVLRSRIGPERALDLLSGEQLPRIC